MTGEIALAAPRSAALTDKIAYARELAQSGLLPAAFRKQPANVLYAYEYGEMLGLPPMAALTGIHVIEGKPSASSALMSALVRRAGHRLRITGNDEKAVVEITRVDDPEFTFRAEWSLQRAQQAGLTSKDVWKKYPAAMLKARAISECARDACEETLMGMHYTPEELGADVDEAGAPVRATAVRVHANEPLEDLPVPDWDALITEHETARDLAALGDLWKMARHREPDNEAVRQRIAQAAERIKAMSPVAASHLDGEAVESETPPGITEQQSKRLHAMCTKGGINRDTKLALLSHLTGRDITTSADLDVAEAEMVNERIGEMGRGKTSLLEAVIELIDRPEAGEQS